LLRKSDIIRTTRHNLR